MTEIIDYIFKRRSIRSFTGQPLDRQTLILLLQAAMAAPSAVNSQPWEFVVVTETAVLDRLRQRVGRRDVELTAHRGGRGRAPQRSRRRRAA